MDPDPAKLDSRQVARRLGPALNAPGRRADPTPALDPLLAGRGLGGPRDGGGGVPRFWGRRSPPPPVAPTRRPPSICSGQGVSWAPTDTWRTCPPRWSGRG